MKTYKTYAEAKLAHPDCGIYRIGSEFTASCTSSTGSILQPVNPADHLMSLEEFLAAGYLLVNRDQLIGKSGRILIVGKNGCYAVNMNAKDSIVDSKTFILSAACFGGGSHPPVKKMKTKVEFARVTDSVFNLKTDLDSGELYYRSEDGSYIQVNTEKELIFFIGDDNIYRCIETEIDPVEEVAEWFWKNRPNKLSTQEWDLVCSANRETFMWIAKTALENGFKLPDTN